MSLDKAILHKKEKRKPYYRKAQQWSRGCRPNGPCGYCQQNRNFNWIRKLVSLNEQMENLDN